MDVLELVLVGGKNGGDIHVVEGLGVHVVGAVFLALASILSQHLPVTVPEKGKHLLSIPILLLSLERLIKLNQPAHLGKPRQRLHKRKLVKVARGNHARRRVRFHDLADELGRDLGLLRALLDRAVDGRAHVAVHRRSTALGAKVHVDGEKRLVAVLGDPLGHQGFARSFPGWVGWVDAAGVVLEGGQAGGGVDDDVVGFGAGWAGVAAVFQGNGQRVVKVSGADVAAGCAAVLVVDGLDGDKVVGGTAGGLDGGDQGGQGLVGGNDAVVGGARVVLDFLDEQEVGRFQVGDDLGGHLGHVGAGGGEVLDVVGADC